MWIFSPFPREKCSLVVGCLWRKAHTSSFTGFQEWVAENRKGSYSALKRKVFAAKSKLLNAQLHMVLLHNEVCSGWMNSKAPSTIHRRGKTENSSALYVFLFAFWGSWISHTRCWLRGMLVKLQYKESDSNQISLNRWERLCNFVFLTHKRFLCNSVFSCTVYPFSDKKSDKTFSFLLK